MGSIQPSKAILLNDNRDEWWHPNVIRFYASTEDDEKILTVMEFAHRGELLDHITNSPNGRLSETNAAKIIYQVARGLAHCHENGVAHLDVSPENILLTRDFEAKLCDFGLARHMGANGIVARSHSTGKANYMAPEAYDLARTRSQSVRDLRKYRNKRTRVQFAGAPADVFSLGIVAFLCVTGVLPYQLPTRNDRRYVLVTGGEKNMAGLLRRWGISVSQKVVNLLASMLLENPTKRATVEEIMAHPWIVQSLRPAA
mmetsp:Transcript_31735/g.55784  ORF Transcript_31735/g.55784 Transcript_31735/m.55784 type:complete len:257 (+) Transcript_31735:2-772(+)